MHTKQALTQCQYIQRNHWIHYNKRICLIGRARALRSIASKQRMHTGCSGILYLEKSEGNTYNLWTDNLTPLQMFAIWEYTGDLS